MSGDQMSLSAFSRGQDCSIGQIGHWSSLAGLSPPGFPRFSVTLGHYFNTDSSNTTSFWFGIVFHFIPPYWFFIWSFFRTSLLEPFVTSLLIILSSILFCPSIGSRTARFAWIAGRQISLVTPPGLNNFVTLELVSRHQIEDWRRSGDACHIFLNTPPISASFATSSIGHYPELLHADCRFWIDATLTSLPLDFLPSAASTITIGWE